jgi:hypothetical protein
MFLLLLFIPPTPSLCQLVHTVLPVYVYSCSSTPSITNRPTMLLAQMYKPSHHLLATAVCIVRLCFEACWDYASEHVIVSISVMHLLFDQH